MTQVLKFYLFPANNHYGPKFFQPDHNVSVVSYCLRQIGMMIHSPESRKQLKEHQICKTNRLWRGEMQ